VIIPRQRGSRLRQKLNAGALVAVFFSWVTLAAGGDETAQRLPVLHPKFMNPEMQTLIPGSERTVLALAEFSGKEDRNPKLTALPGTSIPEEIIRAADEFLEGEEVMFFRNTDGVVICGILEVDQPAATSAFFSRRFLDRLEPVFGSELLVAAPTAYKVYFFPKLAAEIGPLVPFIVSEYRVTVAPVSEELFEISPNGIRALSVLKDH
jgi:hypothetical protein